MASKPWGFFAAVVTCGLARDFAGWMGRAGGVSVGFVLV